MKVISLGSCCEVTIMLKHLQVFSGACPFDYLTSYDISDVIYFLNNNFSGMNETEIKENYWNYNNLQLCIKNTNIFVPHYTSEELCDRVTRRVKRFLDLTSSGEKIIFVRKSHLHNVISEKETEELKKALSKYTINFDLLLINEFSNKDDVFEIPDIKSDIASKIIYKSVCSNNFTSMNGNPFCVYYCDAKDKEKQFWNELRPCFQ